MKHTDAIKYLKTKIKEQPARKGEVRRQVQALKFDAEGKRRPETGPDRHHLQQQYIWYVKPVARANLIAYGLLRGKPYKAMERTSSDPAYVFSHSVMKAIHEAFGDDEALKAEWPHARILSLIEKGEDSVPVPQAAPEPESKGLLSRIMGAIL